MEQKKIYDDATKVVVAYAESRIGGRRENQDSYGWANTPLGYLVTVCDGMGGGPGGKTASTIAVREIISGVAEADTDEEVENVLIKAVRRANMAIIEAGTANPALRGMGSTATVLLLSEQSAYVAHVGDSRVYQIRGGEKVFRTFDHSMVFELVSEGIITEEQARLSAESNVITRALGIKPDLEVDVTQVSFERGDRFVLCSDGIHGVLPEEELLKLFANKKRAPRALVGDVATLVDKIGHDAGGGHDNLTLAVVETQINSKLKPTMSKKAKSIIAGLAVLLVACLAMNVVQWGGPSADEMENMQAQVAEMKASLDSLTQQNDSLTEQLKRETERINQIKELWKEMDENKANLNELLK